MGKGNFKKAKKKTSEDLYSPNEVHGGTMVKAKMHDKDVGKKAIKSGLVSNGALQHTAEVKNIPKNSMKKKRKRSLVSADDPAFADCFSDTEDTLKKEWNDSSLNEVVKTIMSEGGSLQPNGALLRPVKAVKKKCKTKDAVKSSNNVSKLKKNHPAGHDTMNMKVPGKTSEECSHEKQVSTGCTANVDDPSGTHLETLSPVQKKQKKDTCMLSVTKTNSDCEQIEPGTGNECNTGRKMIENESPSKEQKKKKKKGKASNRYNGDSVVSEVKNSSVHTSVGNSIDEHSRKISTSISSVQSPIKKKNKKKIDPSCLDVCEQNNKASEHDSCDLTPAIINSTESIGTGEASDTSSNSHLFINESYSSKSFCKKLRRLWRGKDVEDWPAGSTVLHVPFNCAHLANFTSSDSNFLDRLKKELRSLPFTFRNNDIFKFHQSGELPLSGACLELRQLLTGPVRDWLISITQIPLTESVDLSASLYLHSDALLCHDDELEGRRIAFILYLTDEHDTWQPADGGSLDLFDGEPGLAGSMVQRLYPRLNTFAFFEVSPRSFHQVSEVLSRTKARLSVSGWFHGPPIHYPPRPTRPPKLFSPPADVEEKVFFSWISPVYLAESLQCSIRRQLAQDSEIQLENFFAPEKFEELSDALRCLDTWRWVGPPTSAHYEVCGTAVPDVVREFQCVMRSEAFFLVLAQLTGVPLHRLAPPDEGGSDDGDSDDGDGSEDVDDEEADSETEEPKLRTLKRILKDHKNKGDSSDGEELGSNVSVGLDEKWSYDLGLPLLSSSACSNSDLTTTSVSDDVTPNKTKPKKLKKAKLEDSKSVKSKENLSVSSSTVSGSADVGSCASALCSIRRLSHGCYSLIRDDDNNDGGNTGGQCGAELEKQRKELDGAATASEVTGGDGRGSAGQKESKVTGKKSKKSNLNGTDHEKEKKRKRPEHENDEDSEPEDDGSYVLDVSLFCNVPEGWSESYGGYTAYVGQHDQEQLLSVMPCNNSLALVYRDHRTHSFIKHINATAGAATFHQIFCQYRES